VLRRLAVQMRTAFGGAPCLKLSVDGYTFEVFPVPCLRGTGFGLRCRGQRHGACSSWGLLSQFLVFATEVFDKPFSSFFHIYPHLFCCGFDVCQPVFEARLL